MEKLEKRYETLTQALATVQEAIVLYQRYLLDQELARASIT
jgi:hypothetical protein